MSKIVSKPYFIMRYLCNKEIIIDGKTVAKPGETIIISEDGQVYNLATSLDIKVSDTAEIIKYLDNIHDSSKVNSSKCSFESIIKELYDTYKMKNHDYGNSFDKSLDEWGLQAAAFRMDDKMNRFKSIVRNGVCKVNDESLSDTLKDLANYCIMTVMYIERNK